MKLINYNIRCDHRFLFETLQQHTKLSFLFRECSCKQSLVIQNIDPLCLHYATSEIDRKKKAQRLNKDNVGRISIRSNSEVCI